MRHGAEVYETPSPVPWNRMLVQQLSIKPSFHRTLADIYLHHGTVSHTEQPLPNLRTLFTRSLVELHLVHHTGGVELGFSTEVRKIALPYPDSRRVW